MKLKKISFTLFLALLVFFNASLPAAQAAEPPISRGSDAQTYVFARAAGFNLSSSVSSIVGTIIQTVLGLLAIIFIVLLISAGFQWMTAEGNEEKVTKAKDTIVRAIIGLAIVIAAYSITYFVFQNLNKAAGESGGTRNEGGSSG